MGKNDTIKYQEVYSRQRGKHVFSEARMDAVCFRNSINSV